MPVDARREPLTRGLELSQVLVVSVVRNLFAEVLPQPLNQIQVGTVSRPVRKDDRPYRALRLVSPQEASVFQAVLSGQFLLKCFTNRDLRQRLGAEQTADVQERRRQSGRTTRLSRRLRAHGLIHKVSGTRYCRGQDFSCLVVGYEG